MGHASSLESAIHHQLARVGSCSLDELVALLPEYSWTQVFPAADRLTRDGTVTLTHQAPFRYLLSLAPRHSVEVRPLTLRPLRRIAGVRIHDSSGAGWHRHTRDALAVCKLRRLRGSRHPGQPRRGLRIDIVVRKTTERTSIYQSAAQSGNRGMTR